MLHIQTSIIIIGAENYISSLSDHIFTSLSTEYAAFAGLVDGSVTALIPSSFS